MYVSYMTVVGCQFFNGFGRYKIDCAREPCLYCFFVIGHESLTLIFYCGDLECS